MINFALVCLVFPAALVLRARWRPPPQTPDADAEFIEETTPETASVELVPRSENPLALRAAQEDDEREEVAPLTTWGRVAVVLATPAELAEAFQRFRSWAAVDHFFGASLPRFVKRRHPVILAVALGALLMAVATAVQSIEADGEPPRFFHRSHNLGLVYPRPRRSRFSENASLYGRLHRTSWRRPRNDAS